MVASYLKFQGQQTEKEKHILKKGYLRWNLECLFLLLNFLLKFYVFINFFIFAYSFIVVEGQKKVL